MVDVKNSPSIPHALSSEVNVSSAYSQNHLFNVNLPQWSRIASAEDHPEDGEDKVNTMIEMLNVHEKRLHMRAEEIKEFYRQLQSAMAIQSEVELDTFQYHAPQYVDTNTYPFANDFAAVPAQQQHWGFLKSAQTNLVGEASISEYHRSQNIARMPIQRAWWSKALPNTAQTSVIDGVNTEQYNHRKMVASHHENRMSPLSHECATVPQAITFVDSGNALGSGMNGSRHWDLPQQSMSSITFAHAATGEESRLGVGASTMASPGSEGDISNTLSSCRQGTSPRGYLCDCGLEIKRKGDWDRHRQSLQHSPERRYACSCGKAYTRRDSLKRHRKVCKKERY